MLEDGYNIPRPAVADSLSDLISDDLLVLIRTFHLSPDQFKEIVMSLALPRPALGVAEAKSLLQVTQKRQTEYATTIVQDDEILSKLTENARNGPDGLSDSSHRRLLMAVKVRKGEKEILSQLSTLLEQYIAENEDTPMGDSHSKRNAQNENDEESGRKKFRKA